MIAKETKPHRNIIKPTEKINMYLTERQFITLPLVMGIALLIMSCGETQRDARNFLHKAKSFENGKQYAQAEVAYKKAIAIYEKNNSKDDSVMAVCWGGLGRVYLLQEKFADAESALKHAIQIDTVISEDKVANLYALALAISFARNQNEYDEAEEYLEEAIINLAIVCMMDPNTDAWKVCPDYYAELADIQVATEKFEEAEKNYKNAIEIYEAYTKTTQPSDRFVRTLRNYSALLFAMGKNSEATAISERAEELQNDINK